MPDRDQPPCLYVLAGTNGAGRSGIAGSAFLAKGAVYFNPNDAAARIRGARPHLSVAGRPGIRGSGFLNARSPNGILHSRRRWGGNTIPALLDSALSARLEVRVWHVGLSSVEKGGHSIPEAQIRERYDRSRLNLIQLMPRLTELLVYDNSHEADPDAGEHPEPKRLLHMASGRILEMCDLQLVPRWAKPIFAAALKTPGGTETVPLPFPSGAHE